MDTQLPLETSLRILIHDLPPISSNVCIYRVPKEIRSVNEKAFTPRTVSIGPLHHGKTELQAMEEHKLRCLQAFLNRTKTSLGDCIGVVKECEERARNCYAERIDLTSDQFVKMLLLDSCLIIESILRYCYHDTDELTNYLSKRKMNISLVMDMILLENQLPFFVLDGLFNLGISNYPTTRNLLYLSLSYFNGLTIVHDRQTKIDNVMRYVGLGNEVKHFVDLLRICHLPSTLRLSPDNTSKLVTIRNATNLQEAGMNIKSGSSNCVLDITYSNGVLEIPNMRITDCSECVLRNIVALEECHYPYDSYMIDYIFFMDMLINIVQDVDILIHNRILENCLSDNSAVANLFNGLGSKITVNGPNYYFNNVSENMNAYCNVPWNRWRVTFLRDYCSTPWMFASTIAAIILLLLTLIQTICSIISLIVQY